MSRCKEADSPRSAGVPDRKSSDEARRTLQMGVDQKPVDKKPGIHEECPVFLTALFL
jgi:hypothetical protein